MARLDRARFDNGVFPHRCRIEPRFRDLDQQSHVDNVNIAAILEEARVRFIYATELMKERRYQFVIAATVIEYASDLLYPDPIEIATGILEIGRTSFRYGQTASQTRGIAAYAEFVQVVRDSSGPVPIPDDMRAKLEKLRIEQKPGAG